MFFFPLIRKNKKSQDGTRCSRYSVTAHSFVTPMDENTKGVFLVTMLTGDKMTTEYQPTVEHTVSFERWCDVIVVFANPCLTLTSPCLLSHVLS